MFRFLGKAPGGESPRRGFALRFAKMLLAFCVVVLFAYLCGWLYFAFSWSSIGKPLRRGTLTHFYCINSKVVRHCPVIKPKGEALFFEEIGELTEPPSNRLEYESAEDRDVLASSLKEYLLKAGYREGHVEGSIMAVLPSDGTVTYFNKEVREVQLYVSDKLASDTADVRVTEWKYD